MKQGWTYKTLGQVCKMYQPHTISSKEMVEDGAYDVFGANGIIGKYNQYNHEFPEILMTCRGATCGNINISTPKSWINGNAMVIHIEDESVINRSFLVYLLSFVDKSHIITGAAQPQITRQTLSPLVICFPSLPEQERIVEQLDAAFAQIDELKNNAERQLAESRALFQSALTQAMQPKPGWQEITFGQLIKLKSGENLPAKSFVEGEYPVYGGNGIAGYHNQFNKEGHQIVIGRVGALCGNVRLIESPFWLTDNGFEVILNKEYKIDLKFLTYLLNFSDLRKYARQAAQPVISNVSLKDIIFSIPPIVEQQYIVDYLDSLSNNVNELEEIKNNTIVECDALKQALLRQIFE